MSEEQDGILIVVKEPGKEPNVTWVKNHFQSMQKIVDGLIEYAPAPFSDEIDIICNEGFLLRSDLEPNFTAQYKEPREYEIAFFGTVFFTRANEEGENVSLTVEDLEAIREYFRGLGMSR